MLLDLMLGILDHAKLLLLLLGKEQIKAHISFGELKTNWFYAIAKINA